MELMRGMMGGALRAFVVKVSAASATLFYTLMITRSLTPEDAGTFFVGLSVLMILAVACRAGLDNVAIRVVTRYLDENRPAMVRIFLFRVLVIVLGCCLVGEIGFRLLGVFGWLPDTVFRSLLMLTVFPVAVTWLCGQILKATGYPALGLSCQGMTVSFLFGAGLAVSEIDLYDVVRLFVVITWAVLIVVLLGTFILIRSPTIASHDSRDNVVAILKTSLPFLFVLILQICVDRSGVILTELVGSAADVARLEVLIRVTNLLTFLLIAANAVVAPRIAQLVGRDHEALTRLLQQTSLAMLVFGSLAFLVLLALGPHILVFFGSGYGEAYGPLMMLSLLVLVAVIIGPVEFVLMLDNRNFALTGFTGLSLALMWILGCLLIPSLGLLGAVVAQGTAYVVRRICCLAYVSSRMNVRMLSWRY